MSDPTDNKIKTLEVKYALLIFLKRLKIENTNNAIAHTNIALWVHTSIRDRKTMMDRIYGIFPDIDVDESGSLKEMGKAYVKSK